MSFPTATIGRRFLLRRDYRRVLQRPGTGSPAPGRSICTSTTKRENHASDGDFEARLCYESRDGRHVGSR